MPEKLKTALPPIPPEVEARIRALADNDEYRARIAEGLSAIERGELGRIVRERMK